MGESLRTYLYEILVRGKPDGALSGAHQITGVVYEDGHERYGSAQPVEIGTVAGILGREFTDLAGQLTIANEKIEELKRTIESRDRDLTSARQEIEVLKAQYR